MGVKVAVLLLYEILPLMKAPPPVTIKESVLRVAASIPSLNVTVIGAEVGMFAALLDGKVERIMGGVWSATVNVQLPVMVA